MTRSERKAYAKAWYSANIEKSRASARAWRAANPEKAKANCKAWRAANPDKVRASTFRSNLKRMYGLAPEEYRRLRDAQNHLCAICKRKPTVLAVDHNHKTKKVRGLLCRPCNSALGLFQENESVLTAAIQYLKMDKAVSF